MFSLSFSRTRLVLFVVLNATLCGSLSLAWAQKPDGKKPAETKKAAAKNAVEPRLTFPPTLPEGQTLVTDTSPDFLKPTETIVAGVAIAKTPPTVDFLYFPGQDYPGNPWSNWGDSLAIHGKYYASIGDHLAIGRKAGDRSGTGTGLVFEYDPATKTMRTIANTSKILNMPEGHYTPGKIHGRLDMDSEGWLYFSTHRGSTTVTSDANHYKGDWVFRVHPANGRTEVLVQGPVPKHCIPNSVLDPDRKIFYGGTAAGTNAEHSGVRFFAYDVNRKKVLYDGPDGPSRYMIFARSTGKVYFTPGKEDAICQIVRFDPDKPGEPTPINAEIGLRSATQETPQGIVYTVSKGGKTGESLLFAFNTKTETVEVLGPAHVGVSSYITTLDADPTGRYVYYIPGAHGGSERDGSAVVQFDTKSQKRKVIAFLHPLYKEKYGATLQGTFSSAVDPDGSKLYINWNVSRAGRVWDCCALTVLHIPESERRP